MKVTLLPENVTVFATLLNKIIPSHPQLPILSNLLLEAVGSGLIMKATDLEMGAQIKVAAKIEEEGVVTVPGKEFLEVIASLPKDKVTISLEKDSLIVSCRGNKMTFNTIPTEEFPQLFKEKGVEVDRFLRKEFIEIFSCLIFSVSNEETRPQLSGVYVDKKKEYVNFVSTDGYRMSVKKVARKGSVGGNLIVPVGLIGETIALKGEDDIVLYVNKEENQVLFEAGDAVIVGRMIEGSFPDYEKVLPASTATKATVNREELFQNVKLASVFGRENSNIASLEVVGDVVKISTRTQGVGEGEVSVECVKEGEDNKISFNIRYLLDVLKNLSSDEVILGLNSAVEPAVFATKEGDFSHVIMPIQVD